MKVADAKRRVLILRVASLVLLVGSTLFLNISCLKLLAWTAQGDASGFASISRFVHSVINTLFEHTRFLSWVWQVAPVGNLRQLNTAGNFGMLLIICCGAFGRLIWDSASRLSTRIKKTLQRVEERGWELALSGQDAAERPKPDVLQIEIELHQSDQWHKRPLGMLLIGVAIAVLGQWANLQFGLVK